MLSGCIRFKLTRNQLIVIWENLSYPKGIQEGLGLFSHAEIGASAPQPEFVDLNFDGYFDVSLLAFIGGTRNAGSNIWLFDPDENQFDYNSVLSGRSLKVDSTKQELTNGWTGGHTAAIYSKSTFRWIAGQATIVRDESQRWNQDRKCYDYRLQVWLEDKLIETVGECLPVPHQYKR